MSSRQVARRYSPLGEQGIDPGALSTCPYTRLGPPIPSVDDVSTTAGASYGHGLVMGSQRCSFGKAAGEGGCTGLKAITQLPPDTGRKDFINFPGGIITSVSSSPVSP